MKASISAMNHGEIEATAAAWLARQDNAAAWRDDDELQLQAWLASDTAHRVAWLRLRQAWKHADRMRELPTEAAQTDDTFVPAPPRAPLRLRARQVLAGISLAALVAISASLLIKPQVASVEQRYATAVGDRKDLTLADGSRVTLNTRTTARAAVSAEQRQFWLDEGEAFFDVRPDPRRPFVVTAGHDRITVLGTKFSVRYENGRTRVSVVEGRVRLDKFGTGKDRAPPASATLVGNQVAIAQAGSVAVSATTPEQAQRELGWRKGLIEFENKPLADIAMDFNRYSRRQLVVEGEAAELKLSGRLSIDNVDAFVRLIHTGYGVAAREDAGKIYLSKK